MTENHVLCVEIMLVFLSLSLAESHRPTPRDAATLDDDADVEEMLTNVWILPRNKREFPRRTEAGRNLATQHKRQLENVSSISNMEDFEGWIKTLSAAPDDVVEAEAAAQAAEVVDAMATLPEEHKQLKLARVPLEPSLSSARNLADITPNRDVKPSSVDELDKKRKRKKKKSEWTPEEHQQLKLARVPLEPCFSSARIFADLVPHGDVKPSSHDELDKEKKHSKMQKKSTDEEEADKSKDQGTKIQQTSQVQDDKTSVDQTTTSVQTNARQVVTSPTLSTCPTTTSFTVAPGHHMKEVNALALIMNEVASIKTAHGINLTDDGSPCGVLGSWASKAAGVRFDISMTPNTTSGLHVVVDVLTPSSKTGFMITSDWHVEAAAPFGDDGPFYMSAVNACDRQTAMFVGQCMVYAGDDLVTGSWVIAVDARDCQDTFLSVETMHDEFRRDELHRLAMEKLKKMHCDVETTTAYADTEATTTAAASTTTSKVKGGKRHKRKHHKHRRPAQDD